MRWQSNSTAGAGLTEALRERDDGVVLIARVIGTGTPAMTAVTTAVALDFAILAELLNGRNKRQ